MNRTLTYLSIAAAFVTLSLAGHVAWSVMVGKIGSESATLDTQIQEKTAEAARIEDAKAALASLSANEARVRSYFVPTTDVVPFLEKIGNTGDPVGASVDVVSVTADKDAPPHGRMTLSLRITGSFDAVTRTLGMLEHGPFDSFLSSVTLDSNGADADWVATAVLSIGTQPPQTP